MAIDSNSPNLRASSVVAEELIRRRDILLAEQRELIEERQKVLSRLRRIDRELADCRAVARFFQLEIEFPVQDPEQIDRIERDRFERERAARIAMVRRREAEELMERTRRSVATTLKSMEPSDQVSFQLSVPTEPRREPVSVPKDNEPKSTPPLREVILDRLKAAGDAGMKAAAIREFYERTYGRMIHEKTVGMTLYRLQNDGLVHHRGHIWFFVPQLAETENPGGDTPGPINSEK